MGYIESTSMDGEVISYTTRLSWVVFLLPIILSLIFLFFPPLLIFSGILLVIAIINYSKSEFGVTNKRLVLKTGVIKRKSQETQIKKIEGISVEQGVIGRVLGYGTIVVTGTGGGMSRFANISDPFTFRKRIQEQISAVEASQ